MTRILAIADEVVDSLGPETLRATRPDLVISCGDLPFEYLEYVVTLASVPLVFVRGNHDPGRMRRPEERAPALPGAWDHDPALFPRGCIEVDGAVVRANNLVIGGLGGSVPYAKGPNRYTEAQMRRRAAVLAARTYLRGRRTIDVLVTHAPPRGVGDDDDPAHAGFAVFHDVIRRLSPTLLVHGHVHPYGPPPPESRIGSTRVLNAVGYRVIDMPP
jgi:hypothetical protein